MLKTVMTLQLFFLCLLSLIGSKAEAGEVSEYFVALNGQDSWSGRLANLNKNGSDGPLATVQHALEIARAERKKTPSADRQYKITVRGGLHSLTEPIVVLPEDSGTSANPTLIRSYVNEKATLSGGTLIKGWKADSQGRWHVTLPEVASGKWNFIQLFVNGERRYRPRLPKAGYYYIEKSLPPTPKFAGKGYDQFVFKAGDIKSEWSDRTDIEALVFQNWTMARLRLETIDESKRIVGFTGCTGGMQDYAGLPTGHRYLLENIKEALSEPGEWYLERKTGELTYLPKKGEKIGNVEIVAPRIETIVELRGDSVKHLWVTNVILENLNFYHTNWETPTQGNNSPQAEVNVAAAISGKGVRSLILNGCSVSHAGGYAIELGEGCQNCELKSLRLTDLGAGGVKLGTQQTFPDAERVASTNVVENCVIEHLGRLHPAAIGVWLGQTHTNRVVHNSIYDLYYTGISVGWTWGYGESQAHHNFIANNHIWQIGQAVLSDMGGIYTLGVSPGTVEYHNLVHDIESVDYGGWGIYTDEGSSGILITNNIVTNTKTGGFHQHYGKENIVRNNIFVNSSEGQIIRTRAEDHLSFTFEHNIVYWQKGYLLGANWSGNHYALNSNLYWNPNGKPVDFAKRTFDEWKASGQDKNSLIADPLFVDSVRGNFTVKPESPALKLGFKQIEFTGFGSTLPEDYLSVARAYPASVARAPQPIQDDFESYSVGDKISGGSSSEENDKATVRVTNETASSGKQCLKFTDAPGQKATYNPHIFFQPQFDEGTVVGKFALKWKTGAVFYHEWRGEGGNPYSVGPSIHVDGEGSLTANGKNLMQIPNNTWVKFEISFALGELTTGKYDLKITLPRNKIESFKELNCSPLCRNLRWFGFVSDTNADSIFYLDDIELKPK